MFQPWKEQEVQDTLELQDELIRHRTMCNIGLWLELEVFTPQLKARLLISEEEGTTMRELARRLGGSFSNATVLVGLLVDRGLVERLAHPRTGGWCWSGQRRMVSASSSNSSPPGALSRPRFSKPSLLMKTYLRSIRRSACSSRWSNNRTNK